MKKFIFIVFALFGFAFAQYLDNEGVSFERDEFTGEVMCSQTIVYGDFAMSLVNYNNDPDSVVWFIFLYDLYETPFNLVLAPTNSETVFVKLTEEVRELESFIVETDVMRDGTYMQAVVLPMQASYMDYIVTHDGEVRMRFDGDNFNYDFTFTEQMRILFRTEFLMECVPAGIGG